MADRVTQGELASVMQLSRELDDRSRKIRERLDRGAKVEPGRYFAQSQGDDPTFARRYTGINNCGLEITEFRRTPGAAAAA